MCSAIRGVEIRPDQTRKTAATLLAFDVGSNYALVETVYHLANEAQHGRSGTRSASVRGDQVCDMGYNINHHVERA